MLALAVQHDAEGEVELQITNDTPKESNMTLLFDGVLPTRRRRIEIQTVYLDRLTGIRPFWRNCRFAFGGTTRDSMNA
jgi:hypothetical protein